MDDAIASRVTRKLTVRLVYFAGLLFFLNYLDRVNVGFAALKMNQDLGFTASVYGFGAGVFFISYALLEIPSNLMLRRVGPRLWLARIMITWGIISGCFAFIQGATGFYVLRFLLGAAEAGFVPGVVLYLTFWFPAAYRARAFATFFAASQLSSIIGAPLSGWILSATHELGGISGWRWMFLLEAVPSVIAGIVILFYLPDRPEQAAWLTPQEKTWLTTRLATDEPVAAHGSVGAFLSDARVWTLTGIYFFYAVSVYGILFWLPQIIRGFGNLSPVQVGFLTSVPYICALISMLVRRAAGLGLSADLRGGRRHLGTERRVLDAADILSRRRRSGGRHCVHQLRGTVRRLLRTVRRWLDQGCDRHFRLGAAAFGRRVAAGDGTRAESGASANSG
jgi:MFS family permease